MQERIVSRRNLYYAPVLLVVGVLGLAFFRTEKHAVQAQTATAAASWEYQTSSIELGSLTTKLTELSRDGWDVFNVIAVDTMINQTPDGKTHILTQRVEVTAKRAK
jgi:hypothetical protein